MLQGIPTLIVFVLMLTADYARSAEPPKDFTNSIGMGFRLIPAGEFLMGSPVTDADAEDDEHPQHRVRITKAFYLGVTEVTQDQFERVVGFNPSNFKGKTYPVGARSSHVVEFCTKLSAKEGRQYRLPTEAEWEYACRAGTTTKRHFGDDADRLGEYAWYQDNAHDTTHPVAQKKPNPWGLYDMLGNVAELCSDRHEWEYYKSSPMDDPTGPESGPTVVIRGGIYCLSARYCRSAYRGMVRHPKTT